MMHIVLFVAYGLVALGAFLLVAWLLATFIPVWGVAALINSAVGVMYAGIPLINEAGAFAVIFGVPAAVAWFVSRRRAAGA
ncbi:MAG: hypothetical protein J0H62_06010 [Rhizobiales bacterium]|nr:hypothetical protein [Hyphomicrobiales bacterium]